MKDYKKHIQHFNNKDYYHGQVGSNYKDYSWEGIAPAIKSYADIVEEWFSDIKTNGGEVIDAGCAKGYLVKELTDRGYKAYGFDVSKWAIEEAVKEFPILALQGKFWVDDITKRFHESNLISDKPSSYNLIILSEVLEHIPEEMIDDLIHDLYKFAGKYVLLDMPLEKDPEDKDPTHITIHPREWWDEKLLKYFDYVHTDNLKRHSWNFFPLIKKLNI